MATVFRPPLISPPRAALRPPVFVAPNLLESTLGQAAPAAMPFNQFDWPRPRLTRQLIVDQPLISPANIPATPPAPYNQFDWPLPQLARRPALDQLPNLLTTTLAPAAAPGPFVQTSWPLPQLARRPTLDQLPNLLTSTLAPSPAPAPFYQTDWPLPRAALLARIDWQQNLLATTLGQAAPAALPFNQFAWPQPQRQAPRDGSWISGFALQLQTQAMPFVQTEWPRPRSPREQLPRGFVAFANLSFFGAPAALLANPLLTMRNRDWRERVMKNRKRGS